MSMKEIIIFRVLWSDITNGFFKLCFFVFISAGINRMLFSYPSQIPQYQEYSIADFQPGFLWLEWSKVSPFAMRVNCNQLDWKHVDIFASRTVLLFMEKNCTVCSYRV